MERYERDEEKAQIIALVAAQRAAQKHLAVPSWFWIGTGVLFGVGVMAVSTGITILITGAAALILIGGRILDLLLANAEGIRIGRVFAGGIAGLTALPWLAVLSGLCIIGRFAEDARLYWVGPVLAILAIPVTLAFGYTYDHVRLRIYRLAPQ